MWIIRIGSVGGGMAEEAKREEFSGMFIGIICDFLSKIPSQIYGNSNYNLINLIQNLRAFFHIPPSW